MRSRVSRVAVAGLLLAGLAACSERLTNIPNYNSPTVQGLSTEAAGIQLAATGILIAERNNLPTYLRDVSFLGREGYFYFTTDSRFPQNFLIGQKGPTGVQQLDPAGFASGDWFGFYQNMRNEYTFLQTVKTSSVLTDAQKSAAKGFAETFRALDLYYVIVTRDTLGAPVDIVADVTKPQPFVSRDSVWKTVSALLEQGKTDLQAGGAAFPFSLHSGFNGFDTPATFLKFNRALAARVYANRGSLDSQNSKSYYGQALQALQESFITTPATTADMNVGVYSIYSAAPGDVLNSASYAADPNQVAHAEFVDSIQTQPNGQPDLRGYKVKPLATPKNAPGGYGITAYYSFDVYPTTTSPIAIIRNEELVLIRAEAEIGTGDLPSALADINTVRAVSGGLAPLSLAAFSADPVGALLKERWYSLLQEGHRWNDYRRFGRLNDLPLDMNQPQDKYQHFRAKVMPIPTAECQARNSSQKPAVGC